MSSGIFGSKPLLGGLDSFLSDDPRTEKSKSQPTGKNFLNELRRSAAIVFEEQAAAFTSGGLPGLSSSTASTEVSDYYRPENASARLVEMIQELGGNEPLKVSSVKRGLDGAMKLAENTMGRLPKEAYETAKKAVEELTVVKSEEE